MGILSHVKLFHLFLSSLSSLIKNLFLIPPAFLMSYFSSSSIKFSVFENPSSTAPPPLFTSNLLSLRVCHSLSCLSFYFLSFPQCLLVYIFCFLASNPSHSQLDKNPWRCSLTLDPRHLHTMLFSRWLSFLFLIYQNVFVSFLRTKCIKSFVVQS